MKDRAPAIVNAMTVDVEDYFQVSAFEHVVPRDAWDTFESRVSNNTLRLLQIFAETNTRATFFVLGWVAERFPEIVRAIRDEGHELASHGYGHQLVYSTNAKEFRDDLRRAADAIEAASGVRVRGYRAPSFSITQQSLWALDVLLAEGFEYDASIYPIRHDRYGIPDWQRHIHTIALPAGRLWELPGSTVEWAGINVPIGGGGYFRQLPYAWTKAGIRRLNDVEAEPAIFYLHPWEIDPAQPRLEGSVISGFRHYRNLDKTEARLRQLLKDFKFGPISEVLHTRRAANSHAQKTIIPS